MMQVSDAARGSFSPDDVTLLLKDLTGQVEERETDLREAAIQSGRHYSEDLPIEKLPSPAYMAVFHSLMQAQTDSVARHTGVLTRLVLQRYPSPVFLSLVRAGVPCGVLMRRYAAAHLGVDVPHYGLSIIRDKGFDCHALATVLRRHPDKTPIFVDGWTGKGMITQQLVSSCADFSAETGLGVQPILAVLSDPAHATTLYATREDFINPSCCLNSTVCGLISRSVHNKTLIGPDEFHGVRIYHEFASVDVTAQYLDAVTARFAALEADIRDALRLRLREDETPDWRGMEVVRGIAADFGITDIGRIKPSIGETTRVLLRRVPERVLLREADHPDCRHIVFLAKEKGVPITIYPAMPYLCCGLIADKGGGAD